MVIKRSELKELVKESMRKVLETYLSEEAPPGMEDVVKALKKKKDVSNPYAVAWAMHNKKKGK